MEDRVQFTLVNGWHISVGVDEKENVLHLQVQNDNEKPLIEWAYSETEAEEKEPLNPELQLTPVDVISASLATEVTTTVELSASLIVVVPV